MLCESMNIIKEQKLELKITVFGVIAAITAIVIYFLYTCSFNEKPLIIFGCIFIPIILALGLFFMQQWALVFVCTGICLFIFGFYVNPFALRDMALSNPDYTATVHFMKYTPYTIVGIWVLHVFGKYTKNFYFWPFTKSHNQQLRRDAD